VLNREALTCLFVLIDSRHAPHPIDLDFIQFLGENGVPFALVFTKTDKISKVELDTNLKVYKETLSEHWEELPPMFTTSAIKLRSRDALLDYIDAINASLNPSI
jgi:GTP-binding protein